MRYLWRNYNPSGKRTLRWKELARFGIFSFSAAKPVWPMPMSKSSSAPKLLAASMGVNGYFPGLPVLSNQKMNAYLKEIADLCGIHKRLTFHIARHTFATTITLSNGVPIETVSNMLGHKNIRTTQHYAKIVDNKISTDMKRLMEKLG